jgi:hypothetical protein
LTLILTFSTKEKALQRRFLKSRRAGKAIREAQPKTAALRLGMWIDRSAGDAKYKCGFAA